MLCAYFCQELSKNSSQGGYKPSINNNHHYRYNHNCPSGGGIKNGHVRYPYMEERRKKIIIRIILHGLCIYCASYSLTVQLIHAV